MPSARRAAPPSVFPELAAARGRRARREALTSLLMLALVAGFIAFALLMFGTLARGVLWLGRALWDYLPGVAPSPDALALLLVRMFL